MFQFSYKYLIFRFHFVLPPFLCRWLYCHSDRMTAGVLKNISRDDEQLEAHLVHIQEYVGSSPTPVISYFGRRSVSDRQISMATCIKQYECIVVLRL